MARNTLTIITALALTTASGGCSLFSALGGSSDGSAFAANMEKFEVESIDLVFDGNEGSFCPGTSSAFTVIAQAKKKKTGEGVRLETAPNGSNAAQARGKMDLTEFAMEARGATVERGMLSTSGDLWQTLLGFDVRATYRNDKTKVVEKHFEPVYSCFTGAGSSGASGAEGEGGYPGQEAGQGGGAAGPGGGGGPGPRVVAYVTVVRTPKHSHVGLVKVEGDVEQLTLFDLKTGITVSARGGTGGYGGRGGDGAQGVDPQGAGGPGGPGAQGGPGGDGGEAIVVLDDRYPELASLVRIDVGGGAPGPGGDGGYGGAGGPAPEKACDDCEQPAPGPDGPPGVAGPDGNIAGRDGRSEVRTGDLGAVFATLPAGVRLREDPRPEPPPPPAPAPKSKSGKRRR
jgi:hypothetical protein